MAMRFFKSRMKKLDYEKSQADVHIMWKINEDGQILL